MHKTRTQALDRGGDCCQTRQKLRNTKLADGVAAFKNMVLYGHWVALNK
jgi:hypothetical protein